MGFWDSALIGALAASVLLVCYVYGGYLVMLWILHRCFGKGGRDVSTRPDDTVAPPRITVIVAAYNEEARIARRLQNFLDCNYPAERLEIIIALDGGDDRTQEIVEGFNDTRISCLSSTERTGKSGAQNAAAAAAGGEILLFTDADTEFAVDFLDRIVEPFEDSRVGLVDGRLFFGYPGGSDVAVSQGFYWRMELAQRDLESRLGILAVASGACLALRASLYEGLPLQYGDDCILPLQVTRHGHEVRHHPLAQAHDIGAPDFEAEFASRVRMTLRNWGGTWSMAEMLNPLRHPGVSFGLWSHKILRWLSPVFLAGIFVFAHFLFFQGHTLGYIVAIVADGLLAWTVICVLAFRLSVRLPMQNILIGFAVANSAFMIGVAKGVLGQKMKQYSKGASR